MALYFKQFAIVIALLNNSIWAVTTKPRLSQKQFEGLIGSIPDKDARFQAETLYADKLYDGLTEVVMGYLDEYFDEKNNDEVREAKNPKKEVIMDAVLSFLGDKMKKRAEEEVALVERIDVISNDKVKEEAFNLLADEKYEELEDMLSSEEEAEFEESEDSQDSTSELDLFDIIDGIPNDEVKEEAFNLLADKKYEELEDKLIKYIDDSIASMPDDIRKYLKSQRVHVKQYIEAAVASMAEEEFEESEDPKAESKKEIDLFDIINGIPNKEVQEEALELLADGKFIELKEKLFKYADEYVASLPDNKRKDIESKMDKIKENIDKTVASMAEEAFENSEYSEDKVKSIEESEDSEESEAESEKEIDLFDIINDIPNKEVQEEALHLLAEQKYEEFKDELIKYLDEFIASLPDNKRKDLESNMDKIKQKITKAVASMAEEAFENSEHSEDKVESVDSELDVKDTIEKKLLEIKEEDKKITELLSSLEGKN